MKSKKVVDVLASPFTYPIDLIRPIQRLWSGRPRYRDPAGLPSDTALRNLLETVFHASLLAEEGRQLTLHIIFARPDYFASSADSVVERTIPVRLRIPRSFSVSELLRLAPAVDPWTSGILVCEPAAVSSDAAEPLVIWGTLNLRSDWEQHLKGAQSGSFCPPQLLSVTSAAPGCITVGAGGEGLAVLEHGRMQLQHQKSVPLHRLLPAFRAALTHFDAAVAKCFDLCVLPGSEHVTHWSETSYLTVLRHLLSLARAHGHGACFLLTSAQEAAAAVNQGRLVIKYGTSGLSIAEALIFAVANQLATAAELGNGELASLHGRQPQFAHLIEASNVLSAAVRGRRWNDINECLWDAIRDCSRSIAQFSQVDGAVLLTDRLELLGFGCEIRIEKDKSQTLKRARDWNLRRSTQVPMDSFGMRHRSAFRFCNQFPGSVALTISQDGDMKLVTRRPRCLIYWDITPPGVFFE